MKISEATKQLFKIKKSQGDIDVYVRDIDSEFFYPLKNIEVKDSDYTESPYKNIAIIVFGE